MSVLVGALLCGLVFPSFFGSFQKYGSFLLQIVFFLTSLRMSFHGVWVEFRSWKTILWISVWMLILLPGLVFVLFYPFSPELRSSIILLAAMPVGMTTPLLTQLLQLNVSLALALTLATSVLAPVSVPIIINFLIPSIGAVDVNHLMSTLVQVIVIPFGLAQVVRAFFPNVVHRTRVWHKPCSLAFVGLLIAAITGHYQGELLQRFTLEYGLGLLVMTLFFLGVHFIGYWIVWWRGSKDRLTVTFSVVYMNFTLAIFIAERFFSDPTVIFYTILSILPWNIGMFIFQQVIHRRNY